MVGRVLCESIVIPLSSYVRLQRPATGTFAGKPHTNTGAQFRPWVLLERLSHIRHCNRSRSSNRGAARRSLQDRLFANRPSSGLLVYSNCFGYSRHWKETVRLHWQSAATQVPPQAPSAPRKLLQAPDGASTPAHLQTNQPSVRRRPGTQVCG